MSDVEGTQTANWECSECRNVNPMDASQCVKCGAACRGEAGAGHREHAVAGYSFSPSEWQTLQWAPFWTFSAVAGADSKIDEKEWAAFVPWFEKSQYIDNALMRELFGSILRGFDEVFGGYGEDSRDIATGLKDARSVIDHKLEASDANLFKGLLVAIGMKVAEASGGGLLGLGSRVSADERTALVLVATLIGLEPEQHGA